MLHTRRTKRISWPVQQLDRAGWGGPFASKLTTVTQRDMHRVVTDAVHTVQILTSSLASTDGIEPGRILLPILHAGYAYYPLDLINQILMARMNQRNDEYGGDRFANRMRLGVEIVRSLLDLVEGGSTWEEVKALAQAPENSGVTILNTDIV